MSGCTREASPRQHLLAARRRRCDMRCAGGGGVLTTWDRNRAEPLRRQPWSRRPLTHSLIHSTREPARAAHTAWPPRRSWCGPRLTGHRSGGGGGVLERSMRTAPTEAGPGCGGGCRWPLSRAPGQGASGHGGGREVDPPLTSGMTQGVLSRYRTAPS